MLCPLRLFALLALLPACGLPERRPLEPLGFEVLPEVRDFEGVRALHGYPNPAFQARFEQAARTFAARPRNPLEPPEYDMLVLSSGGVNGAFGAGILSAWTERGDRPEFELVTGVSVGALLAPFAFAGSAFDERLEDLFRGIDRADLMESKSILGSIFWDESLMKSDPLEDLIERGVDEQLLAAIAARHVAGARLYVGTTNLDRGQFVVWDLGAIAASGRKDALGMLRRVLLASASIPVVYPPVIFAHEGGDEMHVDGAVARSMFLPQGIFDAQVAIERAGLDWDSIDTSLFVIHNGCLRPEAAVVQRETVDIASRSLLLMTYSAVMEHVQNLYLVAHLFGADFHFLTIPDGAELMLNDFEEADTEALYQLGRDCLLPSSTWMPAPPGFLVTGELLRLTGAR
ncbi:MAG: patatin-like phospholipase family protein [Planctomycetota bacterium]|nr:patatin-like phospholipase family protein [Planctomycetota bacterium]